MRFSWIAARAFNHKRGRVVSNLFAYAGGLLLGYGFKSHTPWMVVVGTLCLAVGFTFLFGETKQPGDPPAIGV